MPSASEPLTQDAPKRTSPLQDVFLIVALPFLVFFLLLCLFLFIYHDLEPVVWTLVVVCSLLSLVFLGLGIGVRHRVFIAIGLLCLASTVTATVVGKWLDDNYLERYYMLDLTDKQAENLDPTVNPGAAEITIFKFQNTTFVDDMRTVGFMADRKIFCVAPVSKPMGHNLSVEFWATGVDCCEPRQNFDCGAAREQATFGIVAEANPYWDKAISEAKALYNVTVAPENPRLVYFVSGTDQVRTDLWEQALSVCLFASIVEFLMVVCAGFAMFKVLRKQQPNRLLN